MLKTLFKLKNFKSPVKMPWHMIKYTARLLKIAFLKKNKDPKEYGGYKKVDLQQWKVVDVLKI